jgi:hypothetical protein
VEKLGSKYGLLSVLPISTDYFFISARSKCITFLGVFAELREATISFVVSVRPSAWNNSAPTGRIFLREDIPVFFEKSVE